MNSVLFFKGSSPVLNLDEKNKIYQVNVLNKEKSKQNNQDIVNKTKEHVSENIVFRTLRSSGVNDPKKFLISLIGTIVTVVSVAILGNKLTTPAAKLGNSIDNFLTGDNIIGKLRNGVVDFLQKGKDYIKNLIPTPKFVYNIKNALKNPVKPRWQIARGYENGAKGVFSNTIIETITNAVNHDKQSAISTLSNLLGGNQIKANALVRKMAKTPNVKFADDLISEIAKANNCEGDTEKLRIVFEKLSKGEFGSGLNNINMTHKGILNALGSWWPAEIINKFYKGIHKKDCGYLKGNLGDSLIKYASIRGKLAKTLPAKIVQIIPPLVGDQVSNFVNDKSLFGILLCKNLISNFNILQEAPDDKKIPTALNDAVSGSLSWLVAMPVSYGIVYSLASLGKMQGKGFVTSLLRGVGKIFALGLDKTSTLGGLKGIVGGLGRLLLIMGVLQPFIGKKIDSLCSKIFGKPYDPREAQKQKEIEKEMNTIIPELGITQGELLDKLNKNPDLDKILEETPELAGEIQKNPKKLLDVLDGKVNSPKSKQKIIMSPANQKLINKKQSVQSGL